MKPIELLKDEHRVIEVVLNVLESMAERVQGGEKLDRESALEALEFFRNFADRCHHGKEEAHFFTWMESKGFQRNGGPTGVMISEHEMGRAHVRTMAEAVEGAAKGERAAIIQFVEHALGYVQLLREHIEKEDHCLFSMAANVMTPEDLKYLEQQFEHVESHEMGEGTHQKYLHLAKTLASRYQIPWNLDDKILNCGCHH